MVRICYELAPQQGWVKVDAALREMYQKAGKSFLVNLHQYLIQATKGRSRSITLMFEEAAQVFGLTKAWVVRKLRAAEESGLFRIERWVRGYGVDIVPRMPESDDDSNASKAEPNTFKAESSHKTDPSSPYESVISLEDLEINNSGSVQKLECEDTGSGQNESARSGSKVADPKAGNQTPTDNLEGDKPSAPDLKLWQTERIDTLKARCGLPAMDQELVELAIASPSKVFQGILAEFQRQRREIRSAIAWLKVAFRKGYVSQDVQHRPRYYRAGRDGEIEEVDPDAPVVALPFGG